MPRDTRHSSATRHCVRAGWTLHRICIAASFACRRGAAMMMCALHATEDPQALLHMVAPPWNSMQLHEYQTLNGFKRDVARGAVLPAARSKARTDSPTGAYDHQPCASSIHCECDERAAGCSACTASKPATPSARLTSTPSIEHPPSVECARIAVVLDLEYCLLPRCASRAHARAAFAQRSGFRVLPDRPRELSTRAARAAPWSRRRLSRGSRSSARR